MEWALIAVAAAVAVWWWFLRHRPSKASQTSPPTSPLAAVPQPQPIGLIVPSLPRDFEEAIATALQDGQDPAAVTTPYGYRSHHIDISGVSFENANGTSRQKIIAETPPGSTVYLVPEPENERDANAIRVFVSLGGTVTAQIGYRPRDHFDTVAEVRRGNVAAWFASKERGPSGDWGAVLFLVRRDS